ncbi:MAG: outer membrane beta-barrel protein [Desulfomicrobium sp.]
MYYKISFILVSILWLPLTAFGEGNIHFGRIQINPGLSYELAHESNIFKDKNGERADFIHTLRPGVLATYEGEDDNYLRAGYNLGAIRYTDYTDNDYIEHNAIFEGLYRTPQGFYSRLDINYSNTANPIGSSNSYRENEPKVRRWFNVGTLGIGYERNRIRTEVNYTNHYERYNESEDHWQNRNDHQYSILGYYRILPRTSLLAEYRINDINYTNQDNGDNTQGIDSDTSQDATFHQFFIGLNFDPTGKVKGELKLGVGRKDYENDTDWNGKEYEDVTTWLAETNLDWAVTAKTMINAKFARALKDSTESYATRFSTTSVELGVRHTFFEQFTAYATSSYTEDDYDNTSSTLSSRLDRTIGAGTGLEYRFKNWIEDWLTIGIGYSFENCESNFHDEEYLDHRTTLSFLAAF